MSDYFIFVANNNYLIIDYQSTPVDILWVFSFNFLIWLPNIRVAVTLLICLLLSSFYCLSSEFFMNQINSFSASFAVPGVYQRDLVVLPLPSWFPLHKLRVIEHLDVFGLAIFLRYLPVAGPLSLPQHLTLLQLKASIALVIVPVEKYDSFCRRVVYPDLLSSLNSQPITS